MAFESLTEKLAATFKRLRGKGRLSESDVKQAMKEIKMALLEADVNFKVVKNFIASVSERAVGTDVMESLTPAQMIVKIVNEELTALMGGGDSKLKISSTPPTVVMLVGLQGAGKTTNGAKLAGLMKKQGKRPLLVACDIYRPAAIQQLEVVGGQLDIPVFQMGQANPVDIAKAAVEHARRHGNDMVFLDTAGRLHVDDQLMDELRTIKAAVNPTEILLVVDAMIGQDAVNAAKAFDDALDIDGVMLTNGPGDPKDNQEIIQNLKVIIDESELPIFGICMGNQLLSKAGGAKIYKLKYGHRSHNQPVRMVGTERCFITSQNHGYAVDNNTLTEDWEPLFINMNDGSNEGIRHKRNPWFSAQFHPEASSGPTDTEFLFDDFVKLL